MQIFNPVLWLEELLIISWVENGVFCINVQYGVNSDCDFSAWMWLCGGQRSANQDHIPEPSALCPEERHIPHRGTGTEALQIH